VILGVGAEDDVRTQQGLRGAMVEHGLVPKRHAPKRQRLELGDPFAELGVVDIDVELQLLVSLERRGRPEHFRLGETGRRLGGFHRPVAQSVARPRERTKDTAVLRRIRRCG